MNYITTVSGRRIHFPDPSADEFTLYDIAHALSRAPRWCGHTDIPWTVAEHCLLVAELYRLHEVDPNEETYKGLLLHDATEAFLADIPSPVKELLPDYRKLEATLYTTIYKALECLPPECTIKKLWDKLALVLEARDLFRMKRKPWDFGINSWPDYPSIFYYVDPHFDRTARLPHCSDRLRGAYCAAYAAGFTSQTPPFSETVRVRRPGPEDCLGPDNRPAPGSAGLPDTRGSTCGVSESGREAGG